MQASANGKIDWLNFLPVYLNAKCFSSKYNYLNAKRFSSTCKYLNAKRFSSKCNYINTKLFSSKCNTYNIYIYIYIYMGEVMRDLNTFVLIILDAYIGRIRLHTWVGLDCTRGWD
jgi:hypothetical protein